MINSHKICQAKLNFIKRVNSKNKLNKVRANKKGNKFIRF